MINIGKAATIFFGCTEVLIGLVALISLFEAKLIWGLTKPPAVFLFVFTAALVSLILGIGVLNYKMWARKLLLFFAGYIVATKLFIFLGIIRLPPPFEALVPPAVKNTVSLLYHAAIILFFNSERVRRNFK